MNKLLIVTFETEDKAFEGLTALKNLHETGDITLFSTAVVKKDASGKLTVKQSADPGPVGTGVGLLTGSLLGLIGGPVGVAIGAATGGLTGVVFDMARAGVDADFVADVSSALNPGTTALMAEVDEDWVTPVDRRLGELGGHIIRRQRREVVEDSLKRDAEALNTELKSLEAEINRASAETEAVLQAHIDNARHDLESLKTRISGRKAEIKAEVDAKINALRQQAETADKARKAQIGKRSAEIKADFEFRQAKLEQADKLIKEALNPKVHA